MSESIDLAIQEIDRMARDLIIPVTWLKIVSFRIYAATQLFVKYFSAYECYEDFNFGFY